VYSHKPALKPGHDPADLLKYFHGGLRPSVVLVAKVNTSESAMIPDFQTSELRNAAQKPQLFDFIPGEIVEPECPVHPREAVLRGGLPENGGIADEIAYGKRRKIHFGMFFSHIDHIEHGKHIEHEEHEEGTKGTKNEKKSNFAKKLFMLVL